MKQKNTLKWLIAAIAILIAIVFTLVYFNQKETSQRKMFETQSEEIQKQFTSLMGEHEKLKQENQEYENQLSEKDSILHANANEIQRLLVKARNADNYNALKRRYNDLEQEFNGYKKTVDSLRAENDRLTAENNEVKENLLEERTLKNQLQDENSQLSDKVNQASVLHARNVEAAPMKMKSCSKKTTPTNLAKKIHQIDVNMELDENKVAQTGTKTLYVRVFMPNNKVLINDGETANFEFEGNTMEYTAKQDIEFSGNARQVKMIWNKKGDALLLKGFYRISVYCEGSEIGRSKFELK